MKTSLIRLPASTQLTLCLIREELKSRKLFHTLHQAGIQECYFQPHLDSLILESIGLDESDETFSRYETIIERRSQKIEASNDSIMKQALKAYHELQTEKKKLKSKTS